MAEGKRVAELDGELKVLLKHWEDAITKVQKATKFPTLIYEETSRAVGLLRDFSVSDIFYPVNGSLVTLFDKNVSAAEALGNLRSKNMLGTDARINIVVTTRGSFGIFSNIH